MAADAFLPERFLSSSLWQALQVGSRVGTFAPELNSGVPDIPSLKRTLPTWQVMSQDSSLRLSRATQSYWGDHETQ